MTFEFFFGFFFFSEDLEVRLRLLVSRALLAFVILGSVDVVFVDVVSAFDSSDADEDRRRRLLLRDEERFGVVVVGHIGLLRRHRGAQMFS